MRPFRLLFSLILPIALLVSCGGRDSGTHDIAPAGSELEYARLLSMTERPDGSVAVDIRNPWDSSAMLQRLLLIPDSVDRIEDAGGRVVLKIPLRNALVYSSVHTGLISELGAGLAVGGVCDARYVSQPELQKRLKEGSLVDCGNSSSPVTEKIIALRPDAILLSPYEDSTDHSALSRLGTTVIECADYMEPSPLGRAEWMKFYGLIFGKSDEAEKLWNAVSEEYNSMSSVASSSKSRPHVLLDRLYSGIWYLPGSDSLWDILLRDAGAVNPFGDKKGGATLSLSAEQVLAEAADADIWLIRYNQRDSLTLDALRREHPVYSRVKAFRSGEVYGVNTAEVPVFEDMPFHPHLMLGELVRICHPELADSLPPLSRRYFSLLK